MDVRSLKFLRNNLVFCTFAFVFFVHIFQIIFFKNAEFSKRYDVSYWQDRFEHSQWVLPLSQRTIGDDGLYSYIGYQLIHGGRVDGYNPETPPLGKYLFGISIVLFDNPAYVSLVFGSGCLVLFFLLGKKIFKSEITAFYFTVFIFLDKLFFSQLWTALLDIPQLFFLLLNCFLFFEGVEKRKNLFFVGSGISLGFFAITKTPLLFPLIILLEFLVLISKRKYQGLFVFVLSCIAAIFLVYLPYFVQNNSLLDFFKLQKYVLAFYLKSKLPVNGMDVWQTLFTGRFSLFGKTEVLEWTALWPVITLLSFMFSIKLFIRNNVYFRLTAIFLIIALILFSRVPFYPRYLTLVIPLLYLFSMLAVELLPKTLKHVMYISALLYAFYQAFLFLLPSPDSILHDFYYNMSHFYFKDVYQEDITALKSDSRDGFFYRSRNLFDQATIRSLTIREIRRSVPRFSDRGYVDADFTYHTRDLGTFSQKKRIFLKKDLQRWKVEWEWNILLNDYSPDDKIAVELVPAKRGSIVNGDGKTIAYDSAGYLVEVDSQKMDKTREQQALLLISRFVFQQPIRLQNAYLENSPLQKPVAVGTNFVILTEEEKKQLLSFPGIALKPYPVRLYNGINPKSIENTQYEECCTRIYSVYAYHGVKGPEKDFDKILSGHDGGAISMRDKNGSIKKILLQKEKKDGEDVIIQ